MEQPQAALEFLFMFTLKTLTGKDPLPKAVAADFWVNIILCYILLTNIGQTSFVSLGQHPDFSDLDITKTMEHFGPILAETLIYNFSGNAARSELDKLCEPLRRLVVQQVHSKAWLQSALFGKSFTSDKITDTDRKVFLQKILKYVSKKIFYEEMDTTLISMQLVFVELSKQIKLWELFGYLAEDRALHTPLRQRNEARFGFKRRLDISKVCCHARVEYVDGTVYYRALEPRNAWMLLERMSSRRKSWTQGHLELPIWYRCWWHIAEFFCTGECQCRNAKPTRQLSTEQQE